MSVRRTKALIRQAVTKAQDAHGISQTELASKIGVSRSAIAASIGGAGDISMGVKPLVKIARLADLTQQQAYALFRAYFKSRKRDECSIVFELMTEMIDLAEGDRFKRVLEIIYKVDK